MDSIENNKTPEGVKTFAELQKSDTVTADELIATMRDYATNGWAISDRVTIEIINRTELTDDQKATLRELAEEGFKNQDERGETKAATEYKNVADRLK